MKGRELESRAKIRIDGIIKSNDARGMQETHSTYDGQDTSFSSRES